MSTLAERVREAANDVADPCSVAQRMPAGMVDMGLVTHIATTDTEAGTDVEVTLRVTAPGCMYMPYFELELRRRLADLPGLGRVSVVWSPDIDWTEQDMAAPLRAALQARRQASLQRLGATLPITRLPVLEPTTASVTGESHDRNE